MTPFPKIRAACQLLAIVISTVLIELGRAATFTWSGGGSVPPFNNNNWVNPFNWQNGTIPANDGTADVVIPNTPRDNPVVDLPWSIDTLVFQGGGAYLLSGQTLTIAGDLTHNGTGVATISNTIVVPDTGGATWRAAGGPLVLNGAITGGTSNFVLEAPQPITFNGSAANTFSEVIELDEGTLILSKSTANSAIVGNLDIRPTTGNTATVRWDASEQISEAAGVTVNVGANGVLDLNAKLETLERLNVSGGAVQSNGGQLTVENQITLTDVGEIHLSSGELVLPSIVSRTIGGNSATSKITASLVRLAQPHTQFNPLSTPAAVQLEVNGVIADSTAGPSTLRMINAGVLRLTGANTYTGGTIVQDGTLRVDNTSGSATGSANVSVQAGGSLIGDGAISGTVTVDNGGSFSPSAADGGPLGSLAVGGLVLGATASAQFQFDESQSGVTHDSLAVSGSALLGGNLQLQSLSGGVFPTLGQTFTLLTSSSLLGSFANAPSGARIETLEGLGSFLVHYGAGSPFNSQHVVLSAFQRSFSADFDDDGDVDGDDLAQWQGDFGINDLSNADRDNDSDGNDFLLWQRQVGSAPAVAAAAAVPEPETNALLIVSLGLAMGRRRMLA